MPYKINYKKDQDYIAITVEGDFSQSTLKELAADVAVYIEKHACNRILNDLRRASLIRDSFNIYNMPKTARRAGVDLRCKRALLVNDLSEDFQFVETVFLNQGHNVKMFTNIDAAMDWLLNKETHEPGH